ncbi:sigma factor-like helix-turn-helix DNA-binding protein [Salipaludibacillus daqingensis]|uniref:sigma factor-like helix-turn-helix DNA-binding protein n=1 Tax=Salipaludibacillus daqingensis TaxID=3041001 RepID=UPI002476A453|nr:sigma factor-like helix-turn-helix DNA-binding protein [Salipaludibacillus daqingensis]
MIQLGRKNNVSYIIRALRSNNVLPLLEWLKKNTTTFYKIGWAYFNNDDEIELVFLKTTLHACENVDQLADSSHFERWLINIYLEISEKDQTVDRKSDSNLKMKELLTVLDSTTRKMIVLREYGNYSFQHIANILDVSEFKVKSNIYKGLKYINTCY